MKTKKASKTNTRSRIIFFAVALAYNLLLGIYLKDFLVLSPMFTTFYLLSALPTLFLLIETRSKVMRTVIFILFFLILMMNFAYALECRRIMVFVTIVPYGIELIYFFAYARDFGKDSFLTKIYVLAVSGLILVTLISAYNFVCKPKSPYFLNGGATLWDTQTEELADEICAGCKTDEEKIQAFYQWIIQNFEYDYEADPLLQYFDVRRTLRTRKGLCFDFAHLFAAFCRSQNIPCYSVNGAAYKDGALHTWNRVYYDGAWWNVDITADISRTVNSKKLYGFHKLKSIAAPDSDFFIMKIY